MTKQTSIILKYIHLNDCTILNSDQWEKFSYLLLYSAYLAVLRTTGSKGGWWTPCSGSPQGTGPCHTAAPCSLSLCSDPSWQQPPPSRPCQAAVGPAGCPGRLVLEGGVKSLGRGFYWFLESWGSWGDTTPKTLLLCIILTSQFLIIFVHQVNQYI